MFDYQKISSEIINDLPQRTKNVIERRFGLKNNDNLSSYAKIKKEPLESIRKDYGITRERVRQIENDGIKRIKNKIKNHNKIYQAYDNKIEEFGGFKREDIFLKSLGDKKNLNHIFFLLSINDSFLRFSENSDFHPFWSKDLSYFNNIKKVVSSFHETLDKNKKPIDLQECDDLIPVSTNNPKTISSLEISKHIHQSSDGLLGLKNWPEVNPKGIKDKAYLVLKREEKPLHFTSVAQLIGDSTLPQTVHNELIKDPRFILIGRGIYALKEWGYESGEVKDVIKKIIKKAKRPLSKKEIIERVLSQRIVKENTISQNLSNKKHFSKDSKGHYIVNES